MESNGIVSEMIIEKTGVDKNKVDTLVGYMMMCDNKEDVEEIVERFLDDIIDDSYIKRFKRFNLSDKGLKLLNSCLNKLLKYRAKLRVIGKTTFSINMNILMEKVCFIVKLNESDNVVNDTEDLIYYIDKLEMPYSEKERIVDKGCDMSYSSSSGIVFMDKCNCRVAQGTTFINNFISSGLYEKMFSGNRLLYVSPLEYEYVDSKFVDIGDSGAKRLIFNYVNIANELFGILLSKKDLDTGNIRLLREDLKISLNNYVEQLLYKVKKVSDLNGSTGNDVGCYVSTFGSELRNLINIKSAVDIFDNDDIIRVLHNWSFEIKKDLLGSLYDYIGSLIFNNLERVLEGTLDDNDSQIIKYTIDEGIVTVDYEMIEKMCKLVISGEKIGEYKVGNILGTPNIVVYSSDKYKEICKG